MKAQEWLSNATKMLNDAGIGTARLDALVLLEDATGKDRAWLLAHPEFDVRGLSSHILDEQISQRVKHVPLAYIRGKTEFYGREFIINQNVLEPRPESETMFELLLDQVKSSEFRVQNIVDVGTGSGALAITAKLEFPKAEVTAVDIDPNCLKIAKQNANKHNVDIKFYEGDLLEPIFDLTPSTFALLCNLPYVPDKFTINNAAMNEPKLAIFGGPDGLDVYRQLFAQITVHKIRISMILTEAMPPQHKILTKIAKESGFSQIKTKDFIQVFKKSIRTLACSTKA